MRFRCAFPLFCVSKTVDKMDFLFQVPVLHIVRIGFFVHVASFTEFKLFKLRLILSKRTPHPVNLREADR